MHYCHEGMNPTTNMKPMGCCPPNLYEYGFPDGFNVICMLYNFNHKNIERHTADTIVSWPNPKQWVIVHTSDLMMIIRQSIYILSTEMGKLKTYSPTYFIMDNGEKCYIILTVKWAWWLAMAWHLIVIWLVRCQRSNLNNISKKIK